MSTSPVTTGPYVATENDLRSALRTVLIKSHRPRLDGPKKTKCRMRHPSPAKQTTANPTPEPLILRPATQPFVSVDFVARKSRRHLEAIIRFRDDLLRLVELSEPAQARFSGPPRLAAKNPADPRWFEAVSAVDRSVPEASAAVRVAGALISWKIPGSWDSRLLDPVEGWRTLLSDDPWFGLPDLLSCCDRAQGFFERGVHTRVTRERHRTWSRLATPGALITFAVTVAAALVSGYLLHWFGWNS